MSGNAGDIAFSVYQTSNRTPGVFAEVNNTGANTGQPSQRTLIIGQMQAVGTFTPNVPVICSGVGATYAGAGASSILGLMVDKYRRSDAFGELWLLPILGNPSGTLASGSLAVTGPATAAGVIYLYIGGSSVLPRITVPVNLGDTANQIAINIGQAINAVPNCPVSANSPSGTVNLTAENKGLTGNDIDVRLNYLGGAGGETLPAGVGITITPMAGGTLNPVLTTALANIAAQTFDFIVNPYNDLTSLAAVSTVLNDKTGRWSWLEELFGGAFSAFNGTFAAQTTFGVGNNDQHNSVMGVFDSPTPAFMWVADVVAVCATSLRNNPAVPLQYLDLDVFAPPVQSRFSLSERNTLLYDGMSTFIVSDAGQVQVERMVTTYQTNAAGVADNSYLDVETMYTLQALIRDMRSFLLSNYPNKILVADGTRITGGSAMVTAQTILASAIARYNTYCVNGLAQNFTQFAAQASAQNQGGGLVALFMPFQVADQLRQIALLVAFTKP